MGFENLVGITISEIEGATPSSEYIFLYTTDGRKFAMDHSQDCCESVKLYDVVGDVEDLINNPILQAEEVISSDSNEVRGAEIYDSFTWTFYKLATIKGSVTLRWLGESNGYYSESVSFYEVK